MNKHNHFNSLKITSCSNSGEQQRRVSSQVTSSGSRNSPLTEGLRLLGLESWLPLPRRPQSTKQSRGRQRNIERWWPTTRGIYECHPSPTGGMTQCHPLREYHCKYPPGAYHPLREHRSTPKMVRLSAWTGHKETRPIYTQCVTAQETNLCIIDINPLGKWNLDKSDVMPCIHSNAFMWNHSFQFIHHLQHIVNSMFHILPNTNSAC